MDEWDNPNSPFVNRCRIKKISPITIQKMSCENLRKRSTCIGGKMVSVTTSEGTQIQSPVFDSREMDTPNTVAYTLNGIFKEIDNRNCPSISPTKLKQAIESEFPNHRVKRWRNTLQLPSTFSGDELIILTYKLPELSQKWYAMRYNARLDRHYISPKSKSESESEKEMK